MYMFDISNPWTCLRFRSILHSMSDTARDYQTIELASTEGLDDIFDLAPVLTCKFQSYLSHFF